MDQDGLIINRWKRYGKDRLYVETADGDKVGWWDLTTEEGHPEAAELADVLAAARASWAVDSQGVPAAHPADAPELLLEHLDNPSPPMVADARPWIDLAGNAPGEAARDNALSARAADPVKTTLARVLGVHTNERAWRLGADGEEKVADQLAKVAKKDPRWRFLHSIPVGDRGSDIDHVVIGPGGVFTVNAKHHPKAKIWVAGDTFMVDGHRQPYVRNSRHEAARAARLLSAGCGFDVQVEGLLVTVNAADVIVKKPSRGVSVTYRLNLAKWLLQHGEVLSPEVVERVYDVARRSTTWRP